MSDPIALVENSRDMNGGRSESALTGACDETSLVPDLMHSSPLVLSGEGSGLEVRWMTSGNVACSLESTPSLCATDVMAQVHEHVGVPMDEQRLFADGEELQGEDVVPNMRSASKVTLLRSVTDPRITNLGHFYPTGAFGKVPRSAFTSVDKINVGINGDIFKYQYRLHPEGNGFVAVKKIPNVTISRSRSAEKDERAAHLGSLNTAPDAEDNLAEIGVLSYLSQQPDVPLYLLKLVDIFQDREFTWVVTEFADGGELLEVAASGTASKGEVRSYVWQMLQAVAYLHHHRIGHRDISLENALLKDGNVRLIDFGMAVHSHSSLGTPLRYFRKSDKDYYPAPECYVPSVPEVSVCIPFGAAAGEVVLMHVGGDCLCEVRLGDHLSPGATCQAEVWGYQTSPADIFALGVCAYVLDLGCPPWSCSRPSDPSFALVHKEGLEAMLRKANKDLRCSEMLKLLTNMFQSSPALRPSAGACLADLWFEPLAGTPVPTHKNES